MLTSGHLLPFIWEQMLSTPTDCFRYMQSSVQTDFFSLLWREGDFSPGNQCRFVFLLEGWMGENRRIFWLAVFSQQQPDAVTVFLLLVVIWLLLFLVCWAFSALLWLEVSLLLLRRKVHRVKKLRAEHKHPRRTLADSCSQVQITTGLTVESMALLRP